MNEIATPSPIEAAAVEAPSIAVASPETTSAPVSMSNTESSFSSTINNLDENEKIQWVAITIFSIAMIALVYKAMYYKKSLAYLNGDNKALNKKIEELEKNLKAVRGAEYEPIS